MQFSKLWRGSIFERGLALLENISAWRGRVRSSPVHLLTGKRGEDAAYFYLRRNGFTVVARRWSDGPLPGDIDLIAWKEDVLCFIEVKTRTSKDVATASVAVDREKRRVLRGLARQYLRQLQEGDDPDVRFDIVTVYELPGKPREVTLIPAAFGWQG
jgi:putative endonuclease